MAAQRALRLRDADAVFIGIPSRRWRLKPTISFGGSPALEANRSRWISSEVIVEFLSHIHALLP